MEKYIKNMNISIFNLLKLLLSFIFVISFSSCHSKYVSLKNEVCRNGAVWNNDKTQIAFVTIQSASRAPEGISTIPDGGQREIEYCNLVLYTYNTKISKLTKLTEFKDVCYTASRDNYYIDLVFNKSSIYYNINLIGWKTRVEKQVREKYKDKYFSIDTKTKKITQIEKPDFTVQYKKYNKSNQISFKDIHNILKEVPCNKWGLNLQKIYPQSKEDYKDYLINGHINKLTYNCIINQIASSFTKNDINDIIKEMQIHKNDLYKEYQSFDANDPYRKSIKLDEYNEYLNKIKETKKRFNYVQ